MCIRATGSTGPAKRNRASAVGSLLDGMRLRANPRADNNDERWHTVNKALGLGAGLPRYSTHKVWKAQLITGTFKLGGSNSALNSFSVASRHGTLLSVVRSALPPTIGSSNRFALAEDAWKCRWLQVCGGLAHTRRPRLPMQSVCEGPLQ